MFEMGSVNGVGRNMAGSDLEARVARLSLIMPQIITYMQRVPIRSQSTPSVSLPQLRMLLLLDLEGDSTMGELARRAAVTMPTATSSVNALVDGRYVTRRRASHDRRVVVVSLTAKGRRTIADLQEQRRERLHAILASLSAEDQEGFVQAFETILAVLRKIGSGGRDAAAAAEEPGTTQ